MQIKSLIHSGLFFRKGGVARTVKFKVHLARVFGGDQIGDLAVGRVCFRTFDGLSVQIGFTVARGCTRGCSWLWPAFVYIAI